jgi:WD40 repeat protein
MTETGQAAGFTPAVCPTAGINPAARRFDPYGGFALLTLHGHTGPVRCLAYAPDGSLLASGGDDHTVRLWRLKDGIEKAVLRGHED